MPNLRDTMLCEILSDKMVLPHQHEDVYKACESFLGLSKHGERSGEEGNPLAAEVQGPAFSPPPTTIVTGGKISLTPMLRSNWNIYSSRNEQFEILNQQRGESYPLCLKQRVCKWNDQRGFPSWISSGGIRSAES